MRWLMRFRPRRTTILMVGCGAFLLGVVIARQHILAAGWLAALFMVAAVVTLRRRSLITLGIVMVAGLLLGIWRGDIYLRQLAPYQVYAMRSVEFDATADVDAVYDDHSQLSFVVRDVDLTYPNQLHVPGHIKVSGFGVTMVYRGDRLHVSGKLFPTRGSNQATVGFAQLDLISKGASPVDTLRRKFAAGIQTALPEPLASFGLGLLVGQRNTLPAAVSQALLMVGLTHIIAVSGYNLTILLESAKRLFGSRSKVLSTAAAVGLIGGFLLIAGTSASIVRAAVISIIGLMAWHYGRTVRPVLLILLAAAGTTYANPVYLWADISWYLSFLAFFGILVIGPLITRKLYVAHEPPLLLQVAIESVSAEVMTLPIILFIFGQMSLVSLVSNVLIVALIPLGMLLSLVAGLAGMLAGGVAGWLAWPARLLLTYMLDVVNMLSRVPHVFQQNRYLSAADMALCYAAVLAIVTVATVAAKYRSASLSETALITGVTDK